MASYTVKQMQAAEAGMYRVDHEKETCTLVVTWILIEKTTIIGPIDAPADRVTCQIVGLTCEDLKHNLNDLLPELFEEAYDYSSKPVGPTYTTIR